MEGAKKEVLEKAKEYRVKFIRLQFTDIFGVLKNIAITVEDLEKVLNGEQMFDSAVIEGDLDHRESDIMFIPDPESFVIFPWRPREGAVARLLCDVSLPDGSPYPGCSRSLLKAALNEAKQSGFTVKVGTEIEFYLFHTDDRGKPTTTTHDIAGYCDLSPVDLGENARRDMVLTLEEMGFEIGSSHHEVGPGQHEIVLKHDDALAAADHIVTFKFVVRTIAQRHGLHASFMPKPLMNRSGSGLHFHQSLFRDGENCFYDPNGQREMSNLFMSYIAGLLKHAKGFTAITNPLVNSYKRLVPSDVVPVYVAWSQHNRNCIIRVPAKRQEGARAEMRNPDPACNPYLALAVMLKAGLAGIKEQMRAPEPVEENIYRLGLHGTGQNLEPDVLPRDLGQALSEMERDAVVKEALGQHVFHRLITAKRKEWERFQGYVHPWELDEYLTRV